MSDAHQMSEDDVLRRMLSTSPKPHDSVKESTPGRRRGRPVGGNGTGQRKPA